MIVPSFDFRSIHQAGYHWCYCFKHLLHSSVLSSCKFICHLSCVSNSNRSAVKNDLLFIIGGYSTCSQSV